MIQYKFIKEIFKKDIFTFNLKTYLDPNLMKNAP